MTSSPFFLFIVPIKNNSFQAKSLVFSLLQQSFTDWQLLFVDASSSSLHIESLQTILTIDRRISMIGQNQNSPGIYGAMNDGFSNSHNYQWITFWGSDDVLSGPNALNSVYSELSKFPHHDLACFSCNYIDQRGRIYSRHGFPVNYLSKWSLKKLLFLGFVPFHQGTFYSNRLASESPLYSTSLMLASDLLSFLRLSRHSPKVLYSDSIVATLSADGISGKKHFLRLREVLYCYFLEFRFLFFVPFLLRYFRRIL